jgi:hypothetical protein
MTRRVQGEYEAEDLALHSITNTSIEKSEHNLNCKENEVIKQCGN